MRFVIDDSIFRAFRPFGGMDPHLSLIWAPRFRNRYPYRRSVCRKLQETARRRFIGDRYYKEILSDLNLPMVGQAERERTIAVAPPDETKSARQMATEGKGKKRSGRHGRIPETYPPRPGALARAAVVLPALVFELPIRVVVLPNGLVVKISHNNGRARAADSPDVELAPHLFRGIPTYLDIYALFRPA